MKKLIFLVIFSLMNIVAQEFPMSYDILEEGGTETNITLENLEDSLISL